MGKKIFPTDLLDQAVSVQNAWTRIDEKLTVGGMSLANLATNIDDLRQVESTLVSLEQQVTELRIERDELQRATWDKIKRMRSRIRSDYGDDSPQYKLVGGTRLSERKPRRRTPSLPS